ncbi:hypothetical protein BST81_26445 [Leptolyngbya sp. 'hensonii']|uniref:DUF4139 domain-containing protein n=1 Tax=Leptolyngbya sp. 'hensonii' TaxID=1922337 RepID=UPI00094FBA77|nr:DUF4139 domain-containing protein [Leptolyngbya sp. 'hensonii']OLP15419.1 hypothetical protein BST81_26445 [Leptolyngbya sp. 'hensonii']
MTTQLSSRIDKVKVHAAGATITRIAELQARSGFVEITDLPLTLDDSSVRVQVKGDSPLPIAADFRIGLAVPPRTETYPTPAEAELEAAIDQVHRLEDLIALINQEMLTLTDLQVPDRPDGEEGKAPPPSPLSARLALADFTTEQLQARLQERRNIEEQLRLAREHRADLEQRKALASTAQTARPHELRKTLVIRLSDREPASLPSASLRLLVEYFVPGARWTPTYVCRLESRTSTATISVRAFICQRTGEDWSGVRLELSTADPIAWCALPELPARRIGRVQPPVHKSGWRRPPIGAGGLFEDYDRQRQAALATVKQPPVSDLVLPDLVSPVPLTADTVVFRTSDGVYPRQKDAREEEWVFGSIEDESDAKDWFSEATGFEEGALRSADRPRDRAKSAKREVQSAPMTPPPPVAAPGRGLLQRVSKAAVPTSQALVSVAEAAPLHDAFPALEVAPALPTYFLMRLGSADDRVRRGKLAIVRQEEFYLEILQQRQITVSFSVMEVIQEAVAHAQHCLNLPLPPGGIAVRQAAGSFDYAYSADGRVDVASDGSFHSVALTSRSTQVDLRYVVVPREDTSAFRIAQLRNPLAAPLLSGPAEVYVDGEYVLTTNIAPVPPLGQMELGLGVEQAIKVARNTFFQEVRSGKVLVAFNKFRHRIDIEIANRLPRPARMEVRERIPVPQPNAKVEVQVDQVTPEWEKYEQVERETPIQGGYRWQVSVPPGETIALSAHYTIKTYADNEIVGGNRRE